MLFASLLRRLYLKTSQRVCTNAAIALCSTRHHPSDLPAKLCPSYYFHPPIDALNHHRRNQFTMSSYSAYCEQAPPANWTHVTTTSCSAGIVSRTLFMLTRSPLSILYPILDESLDCAHCPSFLLMHHFLLCTSNLLCSDPVPHNLSYFAVSFPV